MKKKNHINNATPIYIFDTLESTMNEIKKKKYNSYKEVVVLAQRQTHGRGRRNNTWVSNKGNLYLSIRLKQKIKKNHHLLTYMFSIVLYEAIKKYIPKSIKQFIKWPNDIYVNKKKISGILIEFSSLGKNINDIIVGIGVNINNNPKKLNKSSTYLKKYSTCPIENIELVRTILLEMNYWLKILNNNKSTILKEWMKRSTKLNSKIKFHHNNKTVNGIYKGLSDDGSIEVFMENKKNNFYNLDIL